VEWEEERWEEEEKERGKLEDGEEEEEEDEEREEEEEEEEVQEEEDKEGEETRKKRRMEKACIPLSEVFILSVCLSSRKKTIKDFNPEDCKTALREVCSLYHTHTHTHSLHHPEGQRLRSSSRLNSESPPL